MRSIMPASLCALALFLAAAAPAGAASRNFGIRSFEKIRIEGPYRVTLKTGVAPYARAVGSQGALDRIEIEMRGNLLVVHAGLSSRQPERDALGIVDVEVGTHDLMSAALNGAGSLNIDKVKGLKFDLSVQGSGLADIGQVAVDQFSLNMGGSANARLAGKVKKMTAVIRGMSTLESSGLQVADATVGAEGPSTVRATITNSAKLDGRGTASFTLAGKPSCTLNMLGSASVSGCK